MSELTVASGYYPPTGPAVGMAPAPMSSGGMQQPLSQLDAFVPRIDATNLGEMTRRGAGSLPAVTGARAAAENARQFAGAIASDAFDGSMRMASRYGAEATGRAAAQSGAEASGRAASTWGARAVRAPQPGPVATAKEFGASSIGLGGAARGTFFSFGAVGRALVSSALFAVPSALITNFIDWKAGRINEKQRNVLIVADSSGYTVVGAASTLIGGAMGATMFGPGVAAVAGIGAALGLGWFYEKYIRPHWAALVAGVMAPPMPPTAPQPMPVYPPVPSDPNLLPK